MMTHKEIKPMPTPRKYTLEGKEVSKSEFLKGIEAGKSGTDTYTPRKAPRRRFKSVSDAQGFYGFDEVLKRINMFDDLVEALAAQHKALAKFDYAHQDGCNVCKLLSRASSESK